MSQENNAMNMNINYNTEKKSDNRIKHLEKENSDLLERNRNLEERLKQLEQYITSNPIQSNNANIYNINLNNNNNTNNISSSKNKAIKSKKSSNYNQNLKKSKNLNMSSDKIKINPSQNLNSNHRTNTIINKNNNNIKNSQYLSTKKSNKSFKINQSKILPSTILKNKNGIEFKNERERDEYNVKILNDMIKEKKREIESLEYELKLQELAQKGEGYLDYELNLWQKKTNTLSTVFYQQFNNIKSEAFLDKNEFQNLIHNMKKICEKNQSYEENICEEILNKQMWFINNLDNKNKDIKNRLEKMKNIFK
jgi:hypothetical protein